MLDEKSTTEKPQSHTKPDASQKIEKIIGLFKKKQGDESLLPRQFELQDEEELPTTSVLAGEVVVMPQ